MTKSKNYQILAPAGSSDQLVAAVNNGCDAVYLGLDSFNARMKAPNFNAENIGHWVNFCHFFGVKVYVTVNTSVKNDEYQSAWQTICVAYQNNVDGVIVTDLSLIKRASMLPKPFEVVASTQLNIHDKYGAQFAMQLGADTVVCARETPLSDIKAIAQTGVNVECFLHGALCVCQSGQCLFSSMVGGNSGNRGLCAQPCRKIYKASEGPYQNGGYLLSASDISSIDTAQKLLDAGVTTFKIEGRNRRPEYAGAASKFYSEFFQSNFKNCDDKPLYEMFNRGNLPHNNYLFGENCNIIYPHAQNHIGVYVGKIHKNFVKTDLYLTKGDGLKVFDGTTEICGGIVTKSGSGMVEATFTSTVCDGMTVHRTTSVELSNEILSAKRKLPVSIQLTALQGQTAKLTLTCQGTSITAESVEQLPQANNAPTTDAELISQIKKLGDLPFAISDIVSRSDGIFMAKSQINALRRQAFAQLQQQIVSNYNAQFAQRKNADLTISNDFPATPTAPCLAIICKTPEELVQCKDLSKYIIYRPQLINLATLNEVADTNCYLDLPSFADLDYLKDIINAQIGIVCHNIGQVQLARELGIPYIVGSGLNIFNDSMAQIFADAQTFFYSQELTVTEVAKFRNQSGLLFVNGDLVLMKLVHCPYKVALGNSCKNCQAHKNLTYVDELGNTFKIQRRRDSRCTFQLINGKKLSDGGRLQKPFGYCVDFDDAVINHYKNVNNCQNDGYTEQAPYTKGRLFNKIN